MAATYAQTVPAQSGNERRVSLPAQTLVTYVCTAQLADRWRVDGEAACKSWYALLAYWRAVGWLLMVRDWRFETDAERPGLRRVYSETRISVLLWQGKPLFAERVKESNYAALECDVAQIRQRIGRAA